MANSLSVSVTVNGTIAGQQFPFSQTYSSAPAGNNAIKETQTISNTVAQVVGLGGVTTPVYIAIANLDATNYLQVGRESTVASTPDRIQPGGVLLISPDYSVSATIWAKANTAPIQIAVEAVNA